MIRIDALWLAVEPVDMRAGADRLLARVVKVFGASRVHHAYLFANARSTRVKLLVQYGFGVWCAVRRLNIGGFVWPRNLNPSSASLTLTKEQFDALVLGRVTGWVHWYNDEHRHSAIRFVTPAQRHAQVDKTLLQARAEVYEMARRQNPLRWSGPTRDWGFIGAVHLNPDSPQNTENEAAKKAV